MLNDPLRYCDSHPGSTPDEPDGRPGTLTAHPSVFTDAVVVGADGQKHTRTAVDWAVRWAVKHHLHVVLLGSTDLDASDLSPDQVRRDLTERLREERTEIHSYYPELRVEIVVVDDPAVTALAAASAHAALTVTGTRHRGDVSTYFDGTVTAALSRDARGPVAVIPSDVDITPGGSVFIGLDDSHAAEDALRFAMRHASCADVPLVALHTCEHDACDHESSELDPSRPGFPSTNDAAACTSYPRSSAIRRLLNRVRGAHPNLTIVHATEPSAFPQPWNRDTVRASMVVVGAQARGRFARLVDGSTSRLALQTRQCAAVIVPPRLRLATS